MSHNPGIYPGKPTNLKPEEGRKPVDATGRHNIRQTTTNADLWPNSVSFNIRVYNKINLDLGGRINFDVHNRIFGFFEI